jgi:hypothetical protein
MALGLTKCSEQKFADSSPNITLLIQLGFAECRRVTLAEPPKRRNALSWSSARMRAIDRPASKRTDLNGYSHESARTVAFGGMVETSSWRQTCRCR